MLNFTSIMELRKGVSRYLSKDMEKIIENLMKIQEEKAEEERKYLNSVFEREEARKKAIETLKKAGLPIPEELKESYSKEQALAELKEKKELNYKRRKEREKNLKSSTVVVVNTESVKEKEGKHLNPNKKEDKSKK